MGESGRGRVVEQGDRGESVSPVGKYDAKNRTEWAPVESPVPTAVVFVSWRVKGGGMGNSLWPWVAWPAGVGGPWTWITLGEGRRREWEADEERMGK